MALTPGTRLGPYEVLAKIGAGGMGEVYKARDTRLTRTVAIKVLPADTADDAAAQARFEREARAIATLSHPHICVVHDVGRQDGTDYLVMELLEGETLAERLARTKGPLPLDQVLAIGIAIADALDKAHRAGIVHRDLKPGNVMLTKTGPKLLDFGLAKLRPSASPVSLSDETSETTAGPGTAKGTILGTVHYMAPEQLEGRDADARTDIWALGALLYEMATGQRPFEGDSAASIIGAILKDSPPPVSARLPLSPPLFDRIVTRCLQKDPDERWQDVRDLKRNLEWIVDERLAIPSERLSVKSSGGVRAAWVIAAAAVLVAAGAVARALGGGEPQARTTTWLSIPPPAGRFGERIELSVSPDGRQVAFSAPDRDGALRLWIRSLDSPTARVLAGTEGGNPGNGAAAWSPDGKSLAFFARGKLLRIDLAGGTPQVLADAPGSSRGASWGTQGTIIFVPTAGSGVYRVAAAGGNAVPLTLSPVGRLAQYPVFLPDGRHFLFETTTSMAGEKDAGVWSASTDRPEVERVSSVVSSVAYAGGYLFFGRQGSLFAQRFDIGRLVTTGEPVRVADGLGSSGGSSEHFAYSVSEQGTVVLANTEYTPRSQLTWYSRSGATSGVVGEPGANMGFALSADSRRVAMERLNPETGSLDLWLVDTATGTPVLFSRVGQQPQWSPVSPDRLLFRKGNTIADGAVQAGSASTVPLGGLPARPNLMGVSPDGRELLVRLDRPGTLADLWVLPLDKAGDAKPYLATSASESAGRFSPNGRWVAYSSDESGRSDIYVEAYPGGGRKLRVSQSGGALPEWSPNGRELYYIAPDNRLMAAMLTESSTVITAAPPIALFSAPRLGGSNSNTQYRREYVAVDDGQRFLINAVIADQVQPTITVIQNWTPQDR